MARPAKPSLFERKLQDLERQRELIESDIRSLSKSMRKLDEGGGLPPLRTRSLESAPAPATRGSSATAAADSPARRREPVSAPTPDLALGTLAGDEGPSPATELAREPEDLPSPSPLVVDTRRRSTQAPPRFANYFASGSFGKSRPLAEERRIQRNKAIFMIIVVLLVVSIAIRFVF